jgi:hypothetical protein
VEPGDVVGNWRVGTRLLAPGKAQFNVTCIHCGAVRVLRKDMMHRVRSHIGCTVVSSKRHYLRDSREYAGDHPQWAIWSAELHMNPELRNVWPVSRVHSIDCWRENAVAEKQTMTIDDWAETRRERV